MLAQRRRNAFHCLPLRVVSVVTLLLSVLSTGCQRDDAPVERIRVVPQVGPVMPRRVTFSPTEQNRLLVVELSGLVGLWDVADMARPELTTSFPASAIEAVFTPDGRTVLTVGPDGRARAWTLDGRLVWMTKAGHDGPARAVAAGSDLVASGGEDGALRFWRLADGAAVVEPIAAHEGPVVSLAVSSQGHVASVGADDALRLWKKHGSGAALQWHGQVLVQGPRRRPLSVFMNELRLDVHCGFDRSIAFSPTGDLIAAALFDGAVRIYALDGTARAIVSDAHSRRHVRGIAFSPSGDRVASAGWDSTIRLWNLDGSPHGQPLRAHRDSAFSISFSKHGDRLASAGLDNAVRFWTQAGRALGELPAPRKERVVAVAMAPKAPLVAVADDTGTIRLWNLDGTNGGTPLTGHKGRVLSIAFSPRGDQLASGGTDRTFRLWNLDGSPQATFPPQGNQVAAVAFSPDGDVVLSGSAQLHGWRANRLAFSGSPGGWDYITSAMYSAKGDVIFTGSRLGRIQILNADGSPRTEPLKLPKEYVRAIAISPDGQHFATAGGEESQVRLWNADLTPLQSPLTGHFGGVRALAFSPNGQQLASGADDGMVRLWTLPGGEVELLLVGMPVNQLGFWNELLWVRADGESIFFFDRSRKLVATTLLRRDALLTYTPDGWYAGSPLVERTLRMFGTSGERLSDTQLGQHLSPEKVRLALSR